MQSDTLPPAMSLNSMLFHARPVDCASKPWLHTLPTVQHRLHAASSGAAKGFTFFLCFLLQSYSPRPVTTFQCVKIGRVTFKI